MTTAATRGRLIVLEGGEGAGKSTHAPQVQRWLQARGRKVHLTREPGGSPLAEAVRGLVLQDWPEGMDAATETLLMFAARATHVRAVIQPALAAGTDVVCDRFVDASYAYQGGGRGVDARHLDALSALALDSLVPDLVLLFDVPPEVGLERAHRRGAVNRFESEALAFMQRVRAAYLERARLDPARFALIDAGASMDAVAAAVQRVLEDRL